MERLAERSAAATARYGVGLRRSSLPPPQARIPLLQAVRSPLLTLQPQAGNRERLTDGRRRRKLPRRRDRASP